MKRGRVRTVEAALPIFDGRAQSTNSALPDLVASGGLAAPLGAEATYLGFDAFHAAEWTDMCRALTLVLGDDSIAIDAAAEGFTRACERWDEVAGYSNPTGWVYRVSLN
ncbi:MAG: hypothetical protein ACKVHU_13775 [Acidimicrobiales bacterium]|jgi:hypothetical protein